MEPRKYVIGDLKIPKFSFLEPVVTEGLEDAASPDQDKSEDSG
jgi:hypothetical protein